MRHIVYEDFADFHYATEFREDKYGLGDTFDRNVMRYIEDHSLDAYLLTAQHDILATYQSLDWEAVDRLVRDLTAYKKVAAFGLLFSETAALDLQMKLVYSKKFIVTNLNDLKQDHYVESAGEDTLIIVFSDSGGFLDKYPRIADFANKLVFSKTKAKVVLITSNPAMEKDPRVAYCVRYQKTSDLCTHRAIYGILTDIIAYKYREFVKKQGKG